MAKYETVTPDEDAQLPSPTAAVSGCDLDAELRGAGFAIEGRKRGTEPRWLWKGGDGRIYPQARALELARRPALDLECEGA